MAKVEKFSIDEIAKDHEIVIVDTSGLVNIKTTRGGLSRDLYGKNTLREIESIMGNIERELAIYQWLHLNLSSKGNVMAPMVVAVDKRAYVEILMRAVNQISTSCGGQGYMVGGRPYTGTPNSTMVRNTFNSNFRHLIFGRTPEYKRNLLTLALLAKTVGTIVEELAGRKCYNGQVWDLELETQDRGRISDVSDLAVAGAAIAYTIENSSKVAVIANDKDVYRIILAAARALDKNDSRFLRDNLSVFRPPRDPSIERYSKSDPTWFEQQYGGDKIIRLTRSG